MFFCLRNVTLVPHDTCPCAVSHPTWDWPLIFDFMVRQIILTASHGQI